VAAARGLAQLALASSRGEAELARTATSVLTGAGLLPLVAAVGVPGRDASPPVLAMPPTRGVLARCFGHLELEIDGQPLDLGAARPRVRSLLRLLLSEPGAPFHHEVIAEAFWPEASPDVGARNLHAAVAALRRLVEPGAVRGGFRLILREGAAYRFALPPGSRIDVLEFDAAIAAARSAKATGDLAAAGSALRSALERYRGDLLSDEGPASWLEGPRERRRAQAVEAAATLAGLYLERGDPEAAAEVCAEGLRIDRYHDPLWRLLIDVRERAGDAGAARRARQGYGRVLTELGVTQEP
jgi:DNA-binding SARP family transcriptional activator